MHEGSSTFIPVTASRAPVAPLVNILVPSLVDFCSDVVACFCFPRACSEKFYVTRDGGHVWCTTCYPGKSKARPKAGVLKAPSGDGGDNDGSTGDGVNQIARTGRGGAKAGGTEASDTMVSGEDAEKPQAAAVAAVAATAVATPGPQAPPPAAGAPLVPRKRARVSGGGATVASLPEYGVVFLMTKMRGAVNKRWAQCGACNNWVHEVSIVAAVVHRRGPRAAHAFLPVTAAFVACERIARLKQQPCVGYVCCAVVSPLSGSLKNCC